MIRLTDLLKESIVNERKYYVTYNKGRGRGKDLEMDTKTRKPMTFNSYKDAKEYAEKMEKLFQHSIGGGTAYWVSDEKMNRLELKEAKSFTIDEASLSRVYQHVSGHPKVKSWGMMSGYRASNTKKENQSLNNKLEKDLRSMNLGFFKVEGHWKECQDPNISWQECPSSKLKDSIEQSFFIPNINKEQLLKLTKEYNQDAAVYGDKESPGEASLLFKNGSTESIGKFNANKVSNAYSQMKGNRSFLFSKPDEKPAADLDKKMQKVLNAKVKNPTTGRDIQVKSALAYDKNHPVYKLAQRMLQQK